MQLWDSASRRLDVPELTRLTDDVQLLLRTRLWAQVVLGMVAGTLVGVLLSPSGAGLLSPEVAATAAEWFGFPARSSSP